MKHSVTHVRVKAESSKRGASIWKRAVANPRKHGDFLIPVKNKRATMKKSAHWSKKLGPRRHLVESPPLPPPPPHFKHAAKPAASTHVYITWLVLLQDKGPLLIVALSPQQPQKEGSFFGQHLSKNHCEWNRTRRYTFALMMGSKMTPDFAGT